MNSELTTTVNYRPAEGKSNLYQLFMLVLCVYAILGMGAETLIPMSDEHRTVLEYADYAVCGLFFLDFLYSLLTAPNGWRYFWTWGWVDLLSSTPSVGALRVQRMTRIIRIFRVMRGVRATKTLVSYIVQRRTGGLLLAAVLSSILTVVFSAVAILQFETVPDSNIKSLGDALWWAVVTITTVGYGDRYPVTSEGRALGALLMTCGVALFGAFSGFVASWFLNPTGEKQNTELAQIHAELQELRKLLAAQTAERKRAVGE